MFQRDRLAGRFVRHAGRKRYKVTDRLEAWVLARTTKHKPGDGSSHWSSRKLAAQLGGDISHMTVARIWANHGIKPHLLEGYLTSNDPDFETKAADMVGLYLNPPQNAVVFSVDEKTAIQALDRLDPMLPLPPGRAERHGFEYFRRGTLALYAACNTKTDEVLGKTITRHTSAKFVAFLTDIVADQPEGKEIDVIADNLSAQPGGPAQRLAVEGRASGLARRLRVSVHKECLLHFIQNLVLHVLRHLRLQKPKAKPVDGADVHFRKTDHVTQRLFAAGVDALLKLSRRRVGEGKCNAVLWHAAAPAICHRLDGLDGDFFSIRLQHLDAADRINRKLPQVVAQMAPGVAIPVITIVKSRRWEDRFRLTLAWTIDATPGCALRMPESRPAAL